MDVLVNTVIHHIMIFQRKMYLNHINFMYGMKEKYLMKVIYHIKIELMINFHNNLKYQVGIV